MKKQETIESSIQMKKISKNSEFQTDVGEILPTYEKYWEMLKTSN